MSLFSELKEPDVHVAIQSIFPYIEEHGEGSPAILVKRDALFAQLKEATMLLRNQYGTLPAVGDTVHLSEEENFVVRERRFYIRDGQAHLTISYVRAVNAL
jgi:hypothetical protein